MGFYFVTWGFSVDFWDFFFYRNTSVLHVITLNLCLLNYLFHQKYGQSGQYYKVPITSCSFLSSLLGRRPSSSRTRCRSEQTLLLWFGNKSSFGSGIFGTFINVRSKSWLQGQSWSHATDEGGSAEEGEILF